MLPINFPEVNITIAKDQPEYIPIPAHINYYSPERITSFCWKLTWKERIKLLFTGRLWHQVMTFGSALQPQMLQVTKPQMVTNE